MFSNRIYRLQHFPTWSLYEKIWMRTTILIKAGLIVCKDEWLSHTYRVFLLHLNPHVDLASKRIPIKSYVIPGV